MKKSGHITVELEPGVAYPYMLATNNKYNSGWGDVNIRKINGDEKGFWESITLFYSRKEDIGKVMNKTYPLQDAMFSRPSTLAVSTDNKAALTGLKVISAPKGGVETNDPAAHGEGKVDNMVNGNYSTYFHSAHSGDQTALPHEYIFDLGGEKTFNYVDIAARDTGYQWHSLGNYRLYVADEYKEADTKWMLLLEEDGRHDNSSASQNISKGFEKTKAKYVKVEVLNNKTSKYAFTVIAEFELSLKSTVKEVISQK